MGINAMENEVYQPQDANSLGKLFNVGLVFIVGFALLFGVAYGVKAESVHFKQYCDEVKCVQVKLCTAVSDECGDMTQGPKADYGTGFHKSADGRQRPNPPAGWKWAGK